MTASLLYRIAAVLLVLFAAAHTIGFLSFVPPTREGVAVRDAMNNVQLVANTRYSYGNFYRGFGLFITVYLLFAAYVAWHLGKIAAEQPQAVGALGWVFCGLQLVSMALAWIYIAAAPTISSLLVALCLGLAAWKGQRTAIRQVSLAAVSLS